MSKDNNPFQLSKEQLQELLRDEMQPDPDELGSPPGGKRTKPSIDDIRFDITPDELIAYLRNYVVGQDLSVEMIATKICTHFHRMQLERTHTELPRIVGHIKANMLLIGPTGVGKTYLIRLIAEKLHVPFVKGDATKFSETGYVGGDVEDLIRELVYQVDDNIPLAEYGIVYIDEIDKIASSGTGWSGPDVSRGGVQRNLLKLMEETEVDMKVPHDLASQMEAVMETQRSGKATKKKVNTHNILFVMSGAFADLPGIVARRLKKGGIGFTGEAMRSPREIEFMLEQLHSQDMVDYGFESEFVGRLPVITFLSELDVEGLFDILRNPKSAVIQGKKRDFAAYGIQLTFDDAAFRFIAEEAYHYHTGARALVRVMERLLLPFERSLPSTEVGQLHVTEELCRDPEGFLRELVDANAIETFTADFIRRTGVQLEFSSAARRLVVAKSAQNGLTVKSFLDEILSGYEHGLKLVGKNQFTVTRNVLDDPKGYLDRLIKKRYQGNS
ncbi:MAG: AAA family ATPase [Candidatus Electryoneaceae bacterium]|nr:AAA family ATPase [Candidatus Electryoneaceae bacterium]